MAKYLTIIAAAIFLCTKDCRASTSCDQGVSISYMNGDMYMRAKSKFSFSGKPKDCADLYNLGIHESGVHTVWPANRLFVNTSLDVYCDMETSGGGWTVIQRRGLFGNSEDYFDRNWDSYKEGFGDKNKEFWLGNDNIYALTNQKLYSARFDLIDSYDKTAVTQYDTFWIDDENRKYMLHIAGYTGNAGDFMSHHHTHKFNTKDQDNGEQKDKNCSQVYIGAWWYDECNYSNLNALTAKMQLNNVAVDVNWLSWRRVRDSLKKTAIKIRPKDYTFSRK